MRVSRFVLIFNVTWASTFMSKCGQYFTVKVNVLSIQNTIYYLVPLFAFNTNWLVTI